MPISERAERITREHLADIAPKIQEIRDLAKSGGENEMHYLQSRCDQVAKLLKEIEEKI